MGNHKTKKTAKKKKAKLRKAQQEATRPAVSKETLEAQLAIKADARLDNILPPEKTDESAKQEDLTTSSRQPPLVQEAAKKEKGDQVIKWETPADITYGQVLSEAQLNAELTAGNGALTYVLGNGHKLPAGAVQSLRVDAAETEDFKPAWKEVTINVLPAKQTIEWPTPKPIWDTTALSDAQLNAKVTSEEQGALTFTPKLGETLAAGKQRLGVTAAATKNFTTETANVTIQVIKAATLQATLKTDGSGLNDLKGSLGEEMLLELASSFEAAQLTEFAEALGDPKKLGALVHTATPARLKQYSNSLGGPKSVAAIYTAGFGEDATKFESLRAELGGTFDALGAAINGGGLAAKPQVLGPLVQTASKDGVAGLKKFSDEFADTTARENLKGILDNGGLDAQPDILANVLENGCGKDPAKLKAFCEKFKLPEDRLKLKELVGNGLGGAPNQGDRLGVILGEGFGGDPEKLKELHAAFKGGDLPKLTRTMDAFSAPPPKPPPPQTGKRVKRVLGKVGPAADGLKDPFYKTLDDQGNKLPGIGKDDHPQSVEDLLRLAAEFDKANIGAVTDKTQNLPIGCTDRMDHYCGRHLTSHFTFDPHELPDEAKLIENLENGQRLTGLSETNKKMTPANQALSKFKKNTISRVNLVASLAPVREEAEKLKIKLTTDKTKFDVTVQPDVENYITTITPLLAVDKWDATHDYNHYKQLVDDVTACLKTLREKVREGIDRAIAMSQKKTTLWPPGTTPANLADYLEKALNKIAADKGVIDPSKLNHTSLGADSRGFWQTKPELALDAIGYSVVVGLQFTNPPTADPTVAHGLPQSFQVIQFYPKAKLGDIKHAAKPELETIEFFDMHAIKKSLKL